jgi:hypothetical protein
LKKTTAAIAIAALAVPAAAQADKPENAGSKGHEKAQQQTKRQGKKSEQRFRGVGFTVRGLDYKGPAPTESRESQTISQFSLDITSANRHARRYLGLTDRPSKREAAQDRSINDTYDGKAIIRLVGFEQGDTITPDDRVKVSGRVTRVRKGDSSTERKLDIRRITIKDVEAQETEQEQKTPEQDD